MFNRNYYKSRKVVAIGSDYFTQGGAWRSIYAYLKEQELNHEPVHLLDLRSNRGLRQLAASAIFSPNILVNSLASLLSPCVIILCLLRRDIVLYLHETQSAFSELRRNHAFKAKLLGIVFRRNLILCVSKQAEIYYRKDLNAQRTKVVYECPGRSSEALLEEGTVNICMIGTIDERKGVELFSRAADIGKKSHPNWRFHWIGGVASTSPLYISENVKFHGWQWEPQQFLRKIDLFFLSSIDDPCPLAALDALSLQRRCVVYRKTGISEIVDGLLGCSVFEEYTPECAVRSIVEALSSNVDGVELNKRLTDMISIKAFMKNIDSAFESGR